MQEARNVHQGGVVERLIGALNGVYRRPDRPNRPIGRRSRRLSLGSKGGADLGKTLNLPLAAWRADAVSAPRHNDDPLQILIAFLPGRSGLVVIEDASATQHSSSAKRLPQMRWCEDGADRCG